MTVSSTLLGLNYPKPRELMSKFFKVARTDTTAAIKTFLPKGSLLVGGYVIGGVASDAATTATLSFGSTSTATEYVSGYDVKTAATGIGYNPVAGKAVGTAWGIALTSNLPVYAKYAETGTASTTGGPWIVKIEYFVPGPGELVDD